MILAVVTIEGGPDQQSKRELFGNRLRAAPIRYGEALAKSVILENICKRTSLKYNGWGAQTTDPQSFGFCVEVRNTRVIQQVDFTHYVESTIEHYSRSRRQMSQTRQLHFSMC